MMKTYNILWIDDEYDSEIQQHFSVRAERKGIDLKGCKSARKGIKELEKNLDKYDGILLDALFFDEHEDSRVENVSLSGFRKVWDRVKELSHKRKLPIWIRSGRADYTDEKSFKEQYGNFFDKKDPSHSDRLFVQIMEDADKLDHTQIRHRYNKVFNSFQSGYLDDGIQSILMDVLLHVEGKTPANSTDSYFNRVRQIIEAIFQSANRYGLLHEKCVYKGKVNLTEACNFLSGKETLIHSSGEKVKSTKNHFPELISDAVFNILKVTNAGSHFEDERKLAETRIKELKQYVDEPYLLHSITFQLLDVLLWFKDYVDKNNEHEINKGYWREGEGLAIKGTVIHKSDNGFAFFKPVGEGKNAYIHKSLVEKYNLNNNDIVQAKIEVKEKIEVSEILKHDQPTTERS